MNITVSLSTYDRSMSLPRALESSAAQSLPHATEWEVLVVENNSGDKRLR